MTTCSSKQILKAYTTITSIMLKGDPKNISSDPTIKRLVDTIKPFYSNPPSNDNLVFNSLLIHILENQLLFEKNGLLKNNIKNVRDIIYIILDRLAKDIGLNPAEIVELFNEYKNITNIESLKENKISSVSINPLKENPNNNNNNNNDPNSPLQYSFKVGDYVKCLGKVNKPKTGFFVSMDNNLTSTITIRPEGVAENNNSQNFKWESSKCLKINAPLIIPTISPLLNNNRKFDEIIEQIKIYIGKLKILNDRSNNALKKAITFGNPNGNSVNQKNKLAKNVKDANDRISELFNNINKDLQALIDLKNNKDYSNEEKNIIAQGTLEQLPLDDIKIKDYLKIAEDTTNELEKLSKPTSKQFKVTLKNGREITINEKDINLNNETISYNLNGKRIKQNIHEFEDLYNTINGNLLNILNSFSNNVSMETPKLSKGQSNQQPQNINNMIQQLNSINNFLSFDLYNALDVMKKRIEKLKGKKNIEREEQIVNNMFDKFNKFSNNLRSFRINGSNNTKVAERLISEIPIIKLLNIEQKLQLIEPIISSLEAEVKSEENAKKNANKKLQNQYAQLEAEIKLFDEIRSTIASKTTEYIGRLNKLKKSSNTSMANKLIHDIISASNDFMIKKIRLGSELSMKDKIIKATELIATIPQIRSDMENNFKLLEALFVE